MIVSAQHIEWKSETDFMRVEIKGRTLSGHLKNITQTIVGHDHLHQDTVGVEFSREDTGRVEFVEDKIGIDIRRDRGALCGT